MSPLKSKADNDKREDGIALKEKAEASSCPRGPTSSAIGYFLDYGHVGPLNS